ncbi:MAG TPA: metallophosphoesterase, partial [Methylophilaceae bacterium]
MDNKLDHKLDRRSFLKLAGMGAGVVFASRLALNSGSALAAGYGSADGVDANDFFFVQMSDTHWGFTGDKVNPDAKGTLQKAVAAVNALAVQPDFIFFTGDLTQTTDDPKERRRRMAEFKDIVSKLNVKNVRFTPGEHDASLDFGAAYQEFFGDTHYTFEHKGIQFIVLDNVSDPTAALGTDQLAWLKKVLDGYSKDQNIVVFTHRPLFDLYPQWDWATRDGQAAIDLLMPYNNVTVFYGHIHQENHHMTGHIAHHSAQSLMFPLPVAGSQPKRLP